MRGKCEASSLKIAKSCFSCVFMLYPQLRAWRATALCASCAQLHCATMRNFTRHSRNFTQSHSHLISHFSEVRGSAFAVRKSCVSRFATKRRMIWLSLRNKQIRTEGPFIPLSTLRFPFSIPRSQLKKAASLPSFFSYSSSGRLSRSSSASSSVSSRVSSLSFFSRGGLSLRRSSFFLSFLAGCCG